MVEIIAFSPEQTARLTGLSLRQLAYWDKTGFFSPSYPAGETRAFLRIYSFRDVVGLRAIAQLRKQVPLQELRRVGYWLSQHHETPWASLTLYVLGRKIAFADPASGVVTEARGNGQTLMTIGLEPIARDVQAATAKMRERRPEQIGQVAQRRNVSHNEPVMAGTRIPTSSIYAFHSAGYDTEAILREYPQLTAADVAIAIKDQELRKLKRLRSA